MVTLHLFSQLHHSNICDCIFLADTDFTSCCSLFWLIWDWSFSSFLYLPHHHKSPQGTQQQDRAKRGHKSYTMFLLLLDTLLSTETNGKSFFHFSCHPCLPWWENYFAQFVFQMLTIRWDQHFMMCCINCVLTHLS